MKIILLMLAAFTIGNIYGRGGHIIFANGGALCWTSGCTDKDYLEKTGQKR